MRNAEWTTDDRRWTIVKQYVRVLRITHHSALRIPNSALTKVLWWRWVDLQLH